MGNNTSSEEGCPTLQFPDSLPGGTGTGSLCSRCLTLLSHVVSQFGDGTGYESRQLLHTKSLSDTPSSCVICKKTKILFDAARVHPGWQRQRSPAHQWSLTWTIDVNNPKHYPLYSFPHSCVAVSLTVRHTGGYSWGIGVFAIYPDQKIHGPQHLIDQEGHVHKAKKHPADYDVITLLDSPADDAAQTGYGDFTSTMGPKTANLVGSWALECAKTHPQCNHIYGEDDIGAPAGRWYPDRLVRLWTEPDKTTVPAGTTISLMTRVVEKGDVADFPKEKYTNGVPFLSLSHSWGPPPNPRAPLQGRENQVLTREKLPEWKKDVPMEKLPQSFQDAVTVCFNLGVEHVWIDSLCIIQDSPEDWTVQSALMADVYKHAFLNITAMASKSDTEGFINTARDVRVDFGFRAKFAQILGRGMAEKNEAGQSCILLADQAALLWNYNDSIPASNGGNAPLFKRAWVFQERSLARRSLGFTRQGVSWACDTFSRCETSSEGGMLEPEKLRGTQHQVTETVSKLRSLQSNTGQVQTTEVQIELFKKLMNTFDFRWKYAIESYTACALTKQTDKLIAFSAVAREFSSSGLTQKSRYLAGLWDMKLEFQLGWFTVEGAQTLEKKVVGHKEYVAPSWSWASIEATVQPAYMFSNSVVALANVVASDVVLKSDFKFGPVTSGWLRLRGRLNRIKNMGSKDSSLYLTDQATGKDFWFSSDTVEGRNTWRWKRALDELAWMPLTLGFVRGALEARCLILAKVNAYVGGDPFVKPGENVYRRLGTGNFGRAPSMIANDALLLNLGNYPEVDVSDDDASRMQAGFQRSEANFEDFVII